MLKILENLDVKNVIFGFKNKDLETQFREKQFAQNYSYNKYIFIFGSLSFLSFYLILYFFYKHGNNYYITIPITIDCLVAIFIIFLLFIEPGFVKKFLHLFIIISLLMAILSLMITSIFHQHINPYLIFSGILLLFTLYVNIVESSNYKKGGIYLFRK